MTAQQLDCEPTWLDPEPDDDEDDGPYCRTVTIHTLGDLL